MEAIQIPKMKLSEDNSNRFPITNKNINIVTPCNKHRNLQVALTDQLGCNHLYLTTTVTMLPFKNVDLCIKERRRPFASKISYQLSVRYQPGCKGHWSEHPAQCHAPRARLMPCSTCLHCLSSWQPQQAGISPWAGHVRSNSHQTQGTHRGQRCIRKT